MSRRLAPDFAVGVLLAFGLAGASAESAQARADAREPTAIEQALISSTVDFCFDPPKTTSAGIEALESMVWDLPEALSPGDDADDPHLQYAFRPLFMTALSVRFDAEDASDSVNNAAFLAASVLGNSLFVRDQTGMSHGEATLAGLGIAEETPHCTITRPAWVWSAAEEAGLKADMDEASKVLAQFIETEPRGTYQMALFNDLNASVFADFPLEERHDLRALLRPSTLILYPTATFDELSK